MPRQYELWDEYQEGKIGPEELASIDDAINSAEAPDVIKDSISRLARSVKRQSSESVSVISAEASVLNKDYSANREKIMEDRLRCHKGYDMSKVHVKQVYAIYFKTLESENYREKKE